LEARHRHCSAVHEQSLPSLCPGAFRTVRDIRSRIDKAKHQRISIFIVKHVASSTLPGGSFRATNISLRLLILEAYRLKGFQLVGGPNWLNDVRFDIVARAPENTPQEQTMAMLRALLAERFKLVAHIETKDQPVYALLTVRADKRLGAKIKPSNLDCSGEPRSQGCGMNTNTTSASGLMKGGGRSLADLATALGNFVVNRAIIDRTGLIGAYDFELSWTPDNLQPASPGGAGAANPNDAPSIFTALQEQLGLKLEPQRGPVEFLVIDSVEQPTPN
jgi:uncharacterized protein (TIGR03435 family)